MIMTKEALTENYASYIKGYEEVQDTIQVAIDICVLATIIVLIVAAFASILKRTFKHIGIGLILLLFTWVGCGFFIMAVDIGEASNNSELEYTINTILPYLFKNEETAGTLKRFDKVNIQIDQDELYNTGIIMGQVVVDDNGEEIIYPFNQTTLGVTSGTKSYLEVNEMDVRLNDEFPKGKAVNILYLNDTDYKTFMNLFGDIPIRIEK